jgi:lipopolysaccharide export system permease protein
VLLPFAFVAIAFAFLGAPRTSRQSRVISLAGVTLSVFLLRLIAFASIAAAQQQPLAVVAQYLVLAGATGLSMVAIVRGVVIEPPAAVTNAINALTERLTRRFATA